jgi:ABC-type sugar transport system substrate-binding protein
MGIDDIQETMDGIREGTIFATMTQNFYRMGYEPVMWLNDFVTKGTGPVNVVNDSGTMVVTLANIDTYNTDMRDPTKW